MPIEIETANTLHREDPSVKLKIFLSLRWLCSKWALRLLVLSVWHMCV